MLSVVCVCFIYSTHAQPTTPDFPTEKVYYSDYYSFQGTDSLGEIHFAIDVNRQRKKRKYKANNFLAFFVDGEWTALAGAGKFTHPKREVVRTPDSPDFQFVYDGELKQIVSESNDLRIDLKQPLEVRADHSKEGKLFQILTTEATLTYQGRTVQGNLISEKLIDPVGLKNPFLLLQFVFGKNIFDGYYLYAPGLGDLYIHMLEGKGISKLFEPEVALLHTEDETIDLEIELANYEITRTKKIGFKKLPLDATFQTADFSMNIRTEGFKKYRNFLVFTFGMGVVVGEVTYRGNTYPVYGLSELIN